MNLKAGGIVYCFDTSALIAAWDERYPIAHFPKFWKHVDDARDAGRVIIPEAVRDETERRSSELNKWIKQAPKSVVGFETEIQQEAKAILKAYPKLVNASKGRTSADPFVIATASTKGFTVVTEEGTGSQGKPKIPDVCRARAVACVGLIQVITTENWVCG